MGIPTLLAEPGAAPTDDSQSAPQEGERVQQRHTETLAATTAHHC